MFLLSVFKRGMPRKIGFIVVNSSSHEDNFSAKELMVHAPTVNGWRSGRYINTALLSKACHIHSWQLCFVSVFSFHEWQFSLKNICSVLLKKVNIVWIKYSAGCAPTLSTSPSSWWREVEWGSCSCWPTSTWSQPRWSSTLETPSLKPAPQGSLGSFADSGETADLARLSFDFCVFFFTSLWHFAV